jgi:hypothetical protein
MENQATETTEQRHIRRFTSYEEFQKAFYPESTKPESPEEDQEEDHDFGTHLAIQSLNRHAEILKFGDS